MPASKEPECLNWVDCGPSAPPKADVRRRGASAQRSLRKSRIDLFKKFADPGFLGFTLLDQVRQWGHGQRFAAVAGFANDVWTKAGQACDRKRRPRSQELPQTIHLNRNQVRAG
jgi:hypothetical protein